MYYNIHVKGILAALIFLSSAICAGQEKHAILIGIGNYPADSGWSVIHGNNDVSILEARLLNQGGEKYRRTTLSN